MINNEDKTMYCKYCSEYYYVTNHDDIIEHETSINHLMNISEKNHRSAIVIEGGDVETIFKKHTNNATKNQSKSSKITIDKSNIGYKLLVNAGWNEKSALGKRRNNNSDRIEPISVKIKNNRLGLGNNNNDYQNKVIDTSKSLEGNVKKKINNYKNNKKRKKEEINKAQQKREERLRMELYNDNVISDEHVDLLLSSSTNTDDNGGGGNSLKKRMRKKNKCGRW